MDFANLAVKVQCNTCGYFLHHYVVHFVKWTWINEKTSSAPTTWILCHFYLFICKNKNREFWFKISSFQNPVDEPLYFIYFPDPHHARIKRKISIIFLFPLLLYLAYSMFLLILWVWFSGCFVLFFFLDGRRRLEVACLFFSLHESYTHFRNLKLKRSDYSCFTYTYIYLHDSNSFSQLGVQILSDISHELYSIGQEFQSLTWM